MKRVKLLFAVLFFVLVLTSCQNIGLNRKEIVKDFTADLCVKKSDVTYKAKAISLSEKRLSIIIDDENALPIEFLFEDGQLKIKYNSLSCIADKNYLPSSSFQEVLFDILCCVDNAKYIKHEELDEYEVTTDKGNAKIYANDGLISEIETDFCDYIFEFSNTEKI